MVEQPPLETLNAMWSKVRSYKKMGEILGVPCSVIEGWMGLEKYLINPNAVYNSEIASSRKKKSRKKTGKKKRVIVRKRKVTAKKKKTKDRRKYYKDYYLKYTKTNPSRMKRRKENALEYARKLKESTKLI